MNKELIYNHIKEKNKQGFTNKKFDTFFDGKVLQICFYSKGCRFSKNGNCIMCDYGKSREENLNSYDKIMNFYKDFNLHKDKKYRKDLLNNMKL